MNIPPDAVVHETRLAVAAANGRMAQSLRRNGLTAINFSSAHPVKSGHEFQSKRLILLTTGPWRVQTARFGLFVTAGHHHLISCLRGSHDNAGTLHAHQDTPRPMRSFANHVRSLSWKSRQRDRIRSLSGFRKSMTVFPRAGDPSAPTFLQDVKKSASAFSLRSEAPSDIVRIAGRYCALHGTGASCAPWLGGESLAF